MVRAVEPPIVNAVEPPAVSGVEPPASLEGAETAEKIKKIFRSILFSELNLCALCDLCGEKIPFFSKSQNRNSFLPPAALEHAESAEKIILPLDETN